jgi:hypothetical protein
MRDGEWEQLSRIAKTIASTEFVPKGLRGNAHGVMAAILYGRDQGLSPMVALSEIHMIEGKPTMSAALIAGKARLAGHKIWRETVEDGQGHVVGVTAHGERTDGTRDSFTFTLDMARRAGLGGKQNWQRYPEAMLWARAVSQLARMLFSDVFMGSVYTAEELGADTDEDGAVLHGEIMEDRPVSGASPADSGDTEPHESTAGVPASSSQPDLGCPAASTPAAGPEGASTSSGPSPFQQPGSVPLDPRNSPCVLFTDKRSTQYRTLKRLDTLIGSSREEGLLDTRTVYLVAREVAPDLIEDDPGVYEDEAGALRYSKLRTVLPLWVASAMIDKLDAQVEFARLAS